MVEVAIEKWKLKYLSMGVKVRQVKTKKKTVGRDRMVASIEWYGPGVARNNFRRCGHDVPSNPHRACLSIQQEGVQHWQIRKAHEGHLMVPPTARAPTMNKA